MSTRALLDCFEAWRARGDALVLATVVETAGSTYTKAGHRILINGDGDYQGLVSGGCLEGDLAAHAMRTLATGAAQLVTYDLREDAGEELFGLAVGCQGLLCILLQRLLPASDYAPFNLLAAALRGDVPGACGLVIDGPDAGATVVAAGSGLHAAGMPAARAKEIAAACRAPGALPRLVTVGADPARVLCAALHPLPRLLVLGAGLDALPVVRLAGVLGYRVSVFDHRPAYLEQSGFGTADSRCSAPAAELADRVDLARHSAALVMSHHLPSDRAYLQALAASPVRYVGLLGPGHRRDRLLRELGDAGAALAGRLHGPAGLDIGADSPESIALSIFAELQAVLARP